MAGQSRCRRGQCHRCRERQRARAGDDQHREGGLEGPRRIDPQPCQRDETGDAQHAAQEQRADAIGGVRHAGPLGLRAVQQSHDRGQHGGGAQRGDAHPCRGGQVHRAGDDRVAAVLDDCRGFTGQQRLVDLAAAIDQPAVRGEGAAGGHAHDITHGKRRERHRFLDAVRADPQRGRRQQARERLGGRAGVVAGDHFKVAAQLEQEHEHRDRVVIDLAAVGERVPRADHVRRHDSHDDRQVHAHAPGEQCAYRAGEQRPGCVQRDRRRHDQADDAQVGPDDRLDAVKRAGIQADRDHHDLHHAEARDRQTLERRAPLACGDLEGVCFAEQVRGVAQLHEAAQDRRQRDDGRIEGQLRARSDRIEVVVADAIDLGEPVLDEPAARRTARALDHQLHDQAAAGRARLCGQHFRPVERCPAVRRRGVLGPGCGGRAPAIVISEACRGDQQCGGLAARAADELPLAVDDDRPRAGRSRQGEGLAAVEAAAGRRGHGVPRAFRGIGVPGSRSTPVRRQARSAGATSTYQGPSTSAGVAASYVPGPVRTASAVWS